ncbi:DUF4397 domain-containing protein [Clostridium sp. AL.422]|uniref:DUF4397 domain-containing protein n=1 Tax=Clostridium TaxID=1485 RepID=UPI00293DCAA3|nr:MULTISPECIES: DUF4397 domain-containing protein [unclassified Clostridium]MDV4150048.1 DUF4397 domain-containing protein [Clostridium sp. AL.422]
MLFRQNLPNLQSKIRFLHAVPGVPTVDVYLNGNQMGKDLAFSDLTCYENIAPGSYEVQLFKTGTYDQPLITSNIDIRPNTSLTVNIVTSGGGFGILTLNDASGKDQLVNSYLRFINLSPNTPLISLSLPNNMTLFENVEYLETTGYYNLSPAIYDFRVGFSAFAGLYKYINDKTLKNGKFYTIYIIGLLNKKPQIGYLIVEDGE